MWGFTVSEERKQTIMNKALIRKNSENKLTSEFLNKKFSYDPETGELRHAMRGRGIKFRGLATSTSSRYLKVKINREQFQAHRVIWCMVYGSFPAEYIDHANGDGCDNRLSNIREATASQNIWNSPARITSNTGHKNISFVKATGRYAISIIVNSITHRWFTDNLPDAIKVANRERLRLHGEFAYVE